MTSYLRNWLFTQAPESTGRPASGDPPIVVAEPDVPTISTEDDDDDSSTVHGDDDCDITLLYNMTRIYESEAPTSVGATHTPCSVRIL